MSIVRPPGFFKTGIGEPTPAVSGDRLTEKRLRYREKIREGLWREFDQTVTMEPEALPKKS